MKQLTLQDIIKKIVKKQAEQEAAELDNPLPSNSSQLDVLSPASTFPPQVKAMFSVAEDVVTVSDEDDDPDSHLLVNIFSRLQ